MKSDFLIEKEWFIKNVHDYGRCIGAETARLMFKPSR